MPFSSGLRLATRGQVVGVIPPANYTGAASTDIFVSTKNTSHITFIIYCGAWAGGTSAITLLQATAVAGTSSKALAFDTVYTNSTTPTTDSTLISTAVVSNTFTIGVAAQVYLIEVDCSTLDVANGFDCVAVHGATPGSNADYYAAVAVSGPVLRYSGSTPPNALAD